MLLLIDFEKAFDSVSFKFIITTLEMFDFGENFIKWVTIILGIKDGKIFTAITLDNENISTPFNVMRGCTQGDPIS